MALALLANNNAKVFSLLVLASASDYYRYLGSGLYSRSGIWPELFRLNDNRCGHKTISEIMHVTSVSGDVMTVIRGQEGTTPVWSTNDIICEPDDRRNFHIRTETTNNFSGNKRRW